jgi:hypothetical protein
VSTEPKKDYARAWRMVDEALDEEEDERISKLTEEELRAELERDAVRPFGPEPNADAFLARLDARAAQKARERAPAPGRPLWRRPLVAIPSALALAAGLALVAYAFRPGPIIGPDVYSPAELQAMDLRDKARQACDASEWQKCLENLDQARTLDPSGDARQRTKELRATAEEGIRDTPPPMPSTPPRPPGPDWKVPPH